MNPKKLQVRMDPNTNALWLVEANLNTLKRIKNIDSDVLLALCADLVQIEGCTKVERQVIFNDGTKIKMTLETEPEEKPNDGQGS